MSMFPDNATRRPIELEYGATDRSMLNFFNAVYAWMAVGLALTATVGYVAAQSDAMMRIVYGGGRGMLVVFSLGMFAISIGAQQAAMKRSAALGTALFLLYCGLMGVLISAIFRIYNSQTLISSFLITGGVFAVMSVYGYVSKRDLTTIGSYLIMAFWGLFVASIVNIFFASNAFSWLITYGVFFVFLGITAYYTQKLKNWATEFEGNAAMLNRLAVVGSLLLYISFINLFISILRIMGNRK